MIFIFMDGVTPAFGISYFLELLLQVFLEFIFMWVIIIAKENAAVEKVENDKYNSDNVGEPPEIVVQEPPAPIETNYYINGMMNNVPREMKFEVVWGPPKE